MNSLTNTIMKKSILIALFAGIMFPISAQFDSTEAINLHASRYAFAPSAYAVPKGTIYYQTYDFMLHDIQLGVTDNFSMGIGLGVPMFAYITPKYSFDLNKKWRMAIGDIAMTSMFTFSGESSLQGNIAYASFTRGNAAKNITFSGGLLSHNLGILNNIPVINTSAMIGVTKNVYMVFEIWGARGNFTENYKQSTWQRDGNGNIKTDGNVWSERALLTYEDKSISGSAFLYMGNLQFRIIGNGENTSSWAFGLSAVGQAGKTVTYTNQLSNINYQTGQYDTEEMTAGYKPGMLVLPSVTYVRKFGDLSKRDFKM